MESFSNANNNVPLSEIDALQAIFDSTDGQNWHWGSVSEGMVWVFDASANPCKDKWQGIECSTLPPLNVVNLTLFQLNLQGTLPGALGSLTMLKFLRISQNEGLIGTLPASLNALSRLVSLDISANGITGTFPPSLANLQELRALMLYGNKLSGQIAETFCFQPKLVGINLAFNRLNGSFPLCLCNSRDILALALNNNSITGTIPSCLANLDQMLAIDLSQNSFSGTIPSAIGSMVRLKQLSLYSNLLSGTLPTTIANLTQLIGLYAYSNALTGTIPTALDQLLALAHLNLEKNLLSGTFPQILSGLTNLVEIDLTSNNLSGSLPASIVQLRNLNYLEIDECLLTGSLPAALGMLSQLQYLQLYSNFLTGQIPASFVNLTELKSFEISHNALTGRIPEKVGQLGNLRYVWLNDNFLIGSIPRSMSAIASLQEIFLSNNQIIGNLYHVFNASTQLSLDTIELSGNQLTGSLPQEIFALPSLRTFAVVSNCIVTELPIEVCARSTLVALVLDGLHSSRRCQQKVLPGLSASYMVPHQLKGGIPACIFSMPNLSTLHLSGNAITGRLSSDLVLSPSLIDLSLSHNSFTGTIPDQMQDRAWYSLDLSYNRFTGTLSKNFASKPVNFSQNAQLSGVDDPAVKVALSLENNRLSGNIPAIIVTLMNVSVLGSNMFFCDISANNLPSHDEDKDKYSCGSDGFNSPYYVWLALIVAGAIAMSTSVILKNYDKQYLGKVKYWLGVVNGNVGVSHISAQVPSLGSIMFVFDASCTLILATLLYGVLVLLPLYVVGSSQYGTFTYKFAWTASAAFLSGEVPTALEMSFFLLLVLLLVVVSYKLCNSYRTDSRTHAGRWSLRFLTTKNAAQRRSLAQRIGAYALFMFCSFAVVIGINVAYVYATLYSSSSVLLLSQILLSFFKLFWNNFCAKQLMRWTVRVVFHSTKYSTEFTQGSELIFVLLFVALVNNIGIPCLVVAVVSPNCFYNLFVPAPAITTSYFYQYCDVINNANGECFSSKYTLGTTTYEPPFSYSYQCSSSFITYYSPAFVFLCITVTILTPLYEALILWTQRHFAADNRFAKILTYFTPRILQPICAGGEEDLSSQTVPGTLFDANHRILTLLSYFGMFMTFGTVFPPLGVALAITLLVSALSEKIKLGRFLALAHEKENKICANTIEAECRGAGGVDVLQVGVWLIITVSCWFYTLFLFDTLGDQQGISQAYWVLIVVPLTPFALFAGKTAAIACYQWTLPTVETLPVDQQNNSYDETGIVMSPMVATA